MGALIFLCIAIFLAAIFLPCILIWYKRNKCPKCGAWGTLSFVKEIIKDKAVGHDKNRYGSGGGRYRYGGLGGFHSSHTSDQPFIRYWVEERYICRKCGRHISILTRKDMR
ncbi:MAG: hypothetical protein ACI4LX_09690 [Treponema sp.]